MEIAAFHPHPWPYHSYHFPSQLLFPYHPILQNYVHWTETPDSHIFSADIPGKPFFFFFFFLNMAGVRKEELRVEVEDSKYLIIRTEGVDESPEPARKFMRKFRLPGRVDLDSISAGYEDGVLTVTVPRSLRRGFYIDPADVPERLEVLARAA